MRRPFSGEETVTLLSFMSSTSDTRAWYVQEWESMGMRSMFRSIIARTISSTFVSNSIYVTLATYGDAGEHRQCMHRVYCGKRLMRYGHAAWHLNDERPSLPHYLADT